MEWPYGFRAFHNMNSKMATAIETFTTVVLAPHHVFDHHGPFLETISAPGRKGSSDSAFADRGRETGPRALGVVAGRRPFAIWARRSGGRRPQSPTRLSRLGDRSSAEPQ